ncbi:MAG: Kazal-type serine protease inhibitor domain-containing protein [Thermoanaerobaculia bacterium]
MVQKATVKLCLCLMLILLVGLATSAWSQSASGDNKAKGYGGSTSSSGSSAKKGAMCGGIAGLKCPEGQACRYPINMCNVADLAGNCVKLKSPCPTGGAKVCGCDGKTYANECELLTAGARAAHKGACKAAATK